MLKRLLIVSCFIFGVPLHAQHFIDIDARLDPPKKTVSISQTITYVNSSDQSLDVIYLNDWANSFCCKTSALGKRFAENYDDSFHFEKNERRGNTTVETISDTNNLPLTWERGEAVDIIKVILAHPLLPGESYIMKLNYRVKIPDDKFTRYGYDKFDNFKLKYWYISPAVYDGKWHAYSNKNTEDLYLTPSDFRIRFSAPEFYTFFSDFTNMSEVTSEGMKTIILTGKNRTESVLYILKNNYFESIVTDKLEVLTNLQDKKVTPPIRALLIDRISLFLNDRLGEYPFEKIVVSEAQYKNNPVYGLNQLPNFISPFPDGFEYDMEQLKSITRSYIENTLLLHPREDSWLIGAIQIHLMMEYVDLYYPKMKIIGSLSDFWVIRWAHAAELEFNDQYPLLYLNMARNNIHQKLTTPRDSLVKFNKNIANDYYGGAGLQYLSDYLGGQVLNNSIKQLFAEKKLQPATSRDFQLILEQNTDLPVNWFFEDYADSRTTIDFKIKQVRKRGDSLDVHIKTLRKNELPVSLYGLNKDSVVFKKWVLPVDSLAIVTIPAKNIKQLALNYEGVIPEFNRRNNYKSVNGILNRPIQFRLFQDVEDPDYNQLFFMPIFEYNLYDGLTTGLKLYNKTVLPKGVHYKIEPQYGYRSKKLIGNGSVVYTQRLEQGKNNLYSMRYGFSGSYYSYDVDLFYKRFTPFMTFAFRNNDLRNNEKQFINIRNINVYRDENVNDLEQQPNYSVYNIQYVYSNPNLINYFRGAVDYQISSKFSKISATVEYRKLFINNRQLNLRLFAGAFIFNDTKANGNFFSFALDRPTDYLFDYTYYGRSEDTGVFSQQLIVAEGGFKSQLEPAFSNSWITTVNASTNIWRWIYLYGDVGLVGNKGKPAKAVFDSGLRINLVADYFELYFPLYSNLGFEPNLPHYDEKVRFVITLSPKTLLGLFTREWY